MRLYFVRHGQSTNNLLFDQTGQYDGRVSDPELTETGQAQAKAVAAWLRDGDRGADRVSTTRNADMPMPTNEKRPGGVGAFGVTHLYTSLMTRAMATADAISAALGLRPVGLVDAFEMGGLYLMNAESGVQQPEPGKGRTAITARFPRMVLPASVGEEGWHAGRPYEVPADRPARARRVLDSLLAAHPEGDCVVLVSHGEFFKHFLAATLNAPTFEQAWIAMNNCAVARFDFLGDRKAPFVDVGFINRAHFMPAHLLT